MSPIWRISLQLAGAVSLCLDDDRHIDAAGRRQHPAMCIRLARPAVGYWVLEACGSDARLLRQTPRRCLNQGRHSARSTAATDAMVALSLSSKNREIHDPRNPLWG